MKDKTRKMVMAAMFAALICVATMIKMPTAPFGYVNLGDCIILLASFLISPFYAFFAAAIGSCVADLISGYMVYVPATFLIKGLMALVAGFGFTFLKKKTGVFFAKITSGIVAELMMVFGYFLFEGLLYGFVPAALNIPANGLQGVFGLVAGLLLIKFAEKIRFRG